MSGQHLHARIGKVIYAAKKRLFKSLQLGADLDLAVQTFISDLSRELAQILKGETQ